VATQYWARPRRLAKPPLGRGGSAVVTRRTSSIGRRRGWARRVRAATRSVVHVNGRSGRGPAGHEPPLLGCLRCATTKRSERRPRSACGHSRPTAGGSGEPCGRGSGLANARCRTRPLSRPAADAAVVLFVVGGGRRLRAGTLPQKRPKSGRKRLA